jgi:hypothetical protein
MIWTVLVFAAGVWCGWYFSVMIDDRLTPQGDD